MDVKVELNDQVVVYEGFQQDSQQSTKVSSDKLAKCFPELFKQESLKKPVADISFRNMLDNPDFLPFPRHVYLRPSIESKNANQFAKELNSIIDVIMGKSDDEEQIEQYLDLALEFLDIFFTISNKDQLKVIPRFQQMEQRIKKLLKLCEWYTKDFSALQSQIEAPPIMPCTDCFVENIRMRKL